MLIQIKNPWVQAIRPQTLSLSLVPVMVGSAIAQSEQQQFSVILFSAIVVAALLIQIGTNLYNDVGDALRGADGPGRLGPKRVVAEGWLSAAQVRRVARACFAAALLVGVYLVQQGGVPILMLGIAAIISGIAYTAGPRPIAYTGLGELFVFLYFGLLAVGGTVWLMQQSWSVGTLWAGSAVGLIAAAVLVVNNYRDIETDRPVGKKTLAVLLGRERTRRLYTLLILFPFVSAYGTMVMLEREQLFWVMILAFPVALYLVRLIYRLPHGQALNRLLRLTAQFQLLFSTLLMIGILV